MNRPKYLVLTAVVALLLSTSFAHAETHSNHFASIMLDGKKIGQVHYSVKHDDEGTLQELKTRASLSILGLEVYHHTLHTHEFWQGDDMKHLWGQANEDGKTYDMDIRMGPDNYTGTLNNEQITLPVDAFPTAVWHYAITTHTKLFSIPELRLLNIRVSKSPDTLVIGKKQVPAEKFVFSGDWESTVWFSRDRQFLKWHYKVKGRDIIVLRDS